MKSYCKDINLRDRGFVITGVRQILKGKYRVPKFMKFLKKYTNKSPDEFRACISNHGIGLDDEIGKIADKIISGIEDRLLEFPDLVRFTRRDPLSGKDREIGSASVYQIIVEGVLAYALDPLYKAHFEANQFASIKGRGAVYGKNRIQKKLRHPGAVYFAKTDIRQCYPSMTCEMVKRCYRKYVKNEDIHYIIDRVCATFDGVMSIGSRFAKDTCNWLMSFAVRFVQDLRVPGRRGKSVKAVTFISTYMDDFLYIGKNKKHLREAIRKATVFIQETFGLSIKNDWRISKIADSSAGVKIDYMGYRLVKGVSTIRRRIFLHFRRCATALERLTRNESSAPISLCRIVCSLYGWVKTSDCFQLKRWAKRIMRIAANKISEEAKTCILRNQISTLNGSRSSGAGTLPVPC